MHSSRIRTDCRLTASQRISGEGGYADHNPLDTQPPWTEWHTPVKTLPSPILHMTSVITGLWELAPPPQDNPGSDTEYYVKNTLNNTLFTGLFSSCRSPPPKLLVKNCKYKNIIWYLSFIFGFFY